MSKRFITQKYGPGFRSFFIRCGRGNVFVFTLICSEPWMILGNGNSPPAGLLPRARIVYGSIPLGICFSLFSLRRKVLLTREIVTIAPKAHKFILCAVYNYQLTS